MKAAYAGATGLLLCGCVAGAPPPRPTLALTEPSAAFIAPNRCDRTDIGREIAPPDPSLTTGGPRRAVRCAATVGGFANAPFGYYTDPDDGRIYQLNYAANADGTANDVLMTRVAAVPEPAALAGFALLAGGLLRRRSRTS